MSPGLIPDFMSAHQADSNSSRETQAKRDFDSSLPLSPCCHCLLLSKQSERGPRGPRLLELCFPISGAATFSSTNPCKRSLHYAAFHSQVLFFTREALSPNKTIHSGTLCVCVCVDILSERLRVFFFFLTLSSLFLKM